MARQHFTSLNAQIQADRAAHPGSKVNVDKSILGDPVGAECSKFLAEHQTHPAASHNPLYALPKPLPDSIETEMKGWLSVQELNFERALCEFCSTRNAVGIADQSLVFSPILQPPADPMISRQLFNKLGWSREQSYEQTQASLGQMARLLEPLHDQAKAYLGWLLTNQQYLAELAVLKKHRTGRTNCRAFSLAPGEQNDPVLQTFLDRWQLSALNSWELPIPQGPNLSGVPWPEATTRDKATIDLAIPVTVGLPTRYPMRQVTEDIRRHNTPPHLREWIEILGGKGGRLGIGRYQRMFPLHFYRNVVLLPRYPDRLGGHVQPLDQAFADFLGIGDDEVKKLRLTIARRLKPTA